MLLRKDALLGSRFCQQADLSSILYLRESCWKELFERLVQREGTLPADRPVPCFMSWDEEEEGRRGKLDLEDRGKDQDFGGKLFMFGLHQFLIV